MLAWKQFRNAVVAMVTVLDTLEQCHVNTALEMLCADHVMGLSDASDILAKLERSGLVAFDVSPQHGRIVAITAKGRALAADLRTLAERTVVA